MLGHACLIDIACNDVVFNRLYRLAVTLLIKTTFHLDGLALVLCRSLSKIAKPLDSPEKCSSDRFGVLCSFGACCTATENGEKGFLRFVAMAEDGIVECKIDVGCHTRADGFQVPARTGPTPRFIAEIPDSPSQQRKELSGIVF